MPLKKQFALLVAGGSGSRMQTDIPKQFLVLAGKPVLMHTISVFRQFNPQISLVVVLPENQIAYWKQLCREYQFEVEHKIVAGGATRFQSVKNGLAAVSGDGVVAVHDGVRPLVPVSVIAEAFAVAEAKGNAVVAVGLKDSIRKVTESGNVAENRADFKLVQTPQCFTTELLRKAYHLPEEATFTDDASVVEKLGESINLTEGSYRNLKITTPEDLVLAEAMFFSLKEEERRRTSGF